MNVKQFWRMTVFLTVSGLPFGCEPMTSPTANPTPPMNESKPAEKAPEVKPDQPVEPTEPDAIKDETKKPDVKEESKTPDETKPTDPEKTDA